LDPLSLIETWWWAGPLAAVVLGVVLGANPLAWPLLATASGIRAGVSGDDSGSVRGDDGPSPVGGGPDRVTVTSGTTGTVPTARTGTATGTSRDRWRADLLVVALGAGVTVVYASLGFVTGQLERIVRDVMGAWSGVGYVLLAVLAAAAGLALLLRPAGTCRTLRRPVGGPALFLLGIPLGIVNCPACAGVITGVAVAAAALGSTAYSVLVMVALGVGHTLALVVVSRLAVNAAQPLLARAVTLQRVGGGLLLATALFFVLQVALRGTSVGPTLP
jgi:cytochrome c biogenesis protein CcdA